jgi:hypothetical protein
MTWVLMLIAVQADTFYFRALNVYQRMDDCLGARAALVEDIGRPIINYQALCIQTDQLKGTL